MSRISDFPDEWIMVDQLKPVDLSNISDKGMQGVVLLAVALGWNLVQRRGAPAQLRSRNGITRNIPTDTGVRQSVFWSMLANILGHSEGRLPTPELLELIVKSTGMSKAHAQVLISKVGILASANPKTLEIEEPEEEPEVEWKTAPEPIISIIEEARASVALDGETQSVGFVPTERVEPTLNQAGEGEQYISEIMDTIIRQLVADGDDQITYRCKVCALEFETKRGVGAHWQVHVKKGEAEATAGNKRTIVNKIEDYVPTEVHAPRKDMAQELRRLRRVVQDVQRAVGQEAIKDAERRVMVAERKAEAMQKERDDAIARAERLASDLRSLRDLIGGISDE